MRVLQGRPVCGLMLGAALAALGACTAEPRYPIEQGQPAGGGIQQVRPRYPTDSDARRGRTDEEGQMAAPSRRAPPPLTPYDSEGNPRTASEGGVSSRSLPPVRSSNSGGGARAASQGSPASPLASPSPYAGGAARPPVLTSPSRVTVKSGETVFDIAERFRTPVRALIEANGLQPPYALEPGAVLQIPPPLVYTVQEGDTLFGVARRFNIDPRSLANLNDISMETQLSRGRPVALPSLARDQGANAQASGPSPVGSALGRAGASGSGLRGEVGSGTASANQAPRVSRPASGLTPKTTADARAAVDAAAAGRSSGLASSAPLGDAQVATAGRGRFITPLRGELISGFGSKGPGQRNDGVNIAAAQGTTVKAAAAGEVAYAGSAIPGFGNLVLIKHAGGWVTAYAHLDSIAVKMRSAVSQGDAVGTVGQSGGVDRPQLHFEIRYPPEPEASAKPIDPALLLPGLR